MNLFLTADEVSADFWNINNTPSLSLLTNKFVVNKVIGIASETVGLIGFGYVGKEFFSDGKHIVEFHGVGRLNRRISYNLFSAYEAEGVIKLTNSSPCLFNRRAHHPNCVSMKRKNTKRSQLVKAQIDRKKKIPRVFKLEQDEAKLAHNDVFLVVRSKAYKPSSKLKVLLQTSDQYVRYIAEIEEVKSSHASHEKIIELKHHSTNDIVLQISIIKRIPEDSVIVPQLKLQGPHTLLYGYRWVKSSNIICKELDELEDKNLCTYKKQTLNKVELAESKQTVLKNQHDHPFCIDIKRLI